MNDYSCEMCDLACDFLTPMENEKKNALGFLQFARGVNVVGIVVMLETRYQVLLAGPRLAPIHARSGCTKYVISLGVWRRRSASASFDRTNAPEESLMQEGCRAREECASERKTSERSQE